MPNDKDPRITALLEPMAAAVARAAPEDWLRATLKCSVTRNGANNRVAYERTGGPALSRSADVDDELRTLFELMPQPGAGMEVELTTDPSGRFEAVVGRRRDRAPAPDFDGHLYVLDPGYVPAEPGEDEEGPADGSAAGDPQEAVRLLRHFLRRRADIPDFTERPNPPADDDLIERVERRLGVALPEDLRALYGVADGATSVFPGHHWWVPVAELLDDVGWSRYLSGRRWGGWGLDWNKTILDAHPAGTVRRVTGHPGWIPFAHGEGGTNWLAVDMSPARYGRPGQVIQIGPDHSEGPGYVADSVTAVLRRCVDALDRGDYTFEDDHLDLEVAEWDPVVTQETRSLTVDAETAPLRGIRPELQALTVWNARTVDLTDLTGAPLLRKLELMHCGTTDLAPLRGLPLETLRLELETADLTPLTGHPTLRSLTLTTARPVDLTPLRTLPRLHGLDLREATVSPGPVSPGLEVLADLAGLRFLFLRSEQWKELRGRTDRLPPLAAAKLGGEVARGRILQWAKGFGDQPRTDEVLRHPGHVEPPV